jgi:hypothetical protein
MTKRTADHGQSAITADLERAIAYYGRQIAAADFLRAAASDSATIAELDRVQAIRRTSLSKLQAELDRATASAEVVL